MFTHDGNAKTAGILSRVENGPVAAETDQKIRVRQLRFHLFDFDCGINLPNVGLFHWEGKAIFCVNTRGTEQTFGTSGSL